jgi:hypothetical protein
MKPLLERLDKIAKDIAEKESCATDEYRIAALRALHRRVNECLDGYIYQIKRKEWKQAKGEIIGKR